MLTYYNLGNHNHYQDSCLYLYAISGNVWGERIPPTYIFKYFTDDFDAQLLMRTIVLKYKLLSSPNTLFIILLT